MKGLYNCEDHTVEEGRGGERKMDWDWDPSPTPHSFDLF